MYMVDMQIKTPARVSAPSRDERIRKTVFAPHATALRRLKYQICHSFENGCEIENKLACCSAQKLKEQDNAVSAKLIKEFLMLVSCPHLHACMPTIHSELLS